MGKKSPKAPTAPDPQETAEAQAKTNKETALWNSALNNVNQITPYGNISYVLGNNTYTGGAPTYDNNAYQSALTAYNNSLKNTTTSNPNMGGVGGGSSTTTVNPNPQPIGAPPKLTDFQIGGGNKDFNGLPQWTSTINLSEDQQAILDSEERRMIAMGLLGEDQIGRIKQSVSTPYSYDALGSANDYATAAENALYSRLNPQFARDEEAMRTRLINQGIGQGSQAYQREMDTFNQMKNDARMQAVLSGQQYGLRGRNQEISEYDAQRNAPLNEYIGLTSGTQVTNPSFSSGNYSGAAPVDYAGLVNSNYQNQMSQYNAQQAGSNNIMGGLFGLGGSFLGAAGQAGGIGSLFTGLSDVRTKENIQHIGNENGFPIYMFNYNQSNDFVRYLNLPETTFIGVMAQDVEKIMPQAVSETNGYKRVNYNMIGVKMREAAQ